MRQLLRTRGRDSWIGESPTRDELEEMLGHDQWMIDILFEASIADVLDHYIDDQRLKDALYGQGVIGAYAAHATGAPRPSSSCTTRATSRARARCGATSRAAWGWSASPSPRPRPRPARSSPAGCAVAEILPGEGVRLEGGELIRARTVICNADPKRALAMLRRRRAVPAAYRARLRGVAGPQPGREVQRRPRPGCPTFTAAGGERGRTARWSR